MNFSNLFVEIIKQFPPLHRKKNPWVALIVGITLGGIGIKIVGLIANAGTDLKKVETVDIIFGFGGLALSIYLWSIIDFILLYLFSWVLFVTLSEFTVFWFITGSGLYGLLRVQISNKQLDEKKVEKPKVIKIKDSAHKNSGTGRQGRTKISGRKYNNIKINNPPK